MELLIIPLVALFASMLTFFSGFGLGTILSPVMMIFFPPEIAIALTGIVHFLNNLFKIGLVRKHMDYPVLLKFGGMALLGAFFGAKLLLYLSNREIGIYSYSMYDKIYSISPVKLTIAVLILLFVVIEAFPAFGKIEFGKKAMLPGGLISGFFGGLSGNQGALRSMFLIRSGLHKEAYIATGIGIACMVDISRIGVYSTHLANKDLHDNLTLLTLTALAAFAGAYAGNKLLKKVTMSAVKSIVAVLLIVIALALGSGLI